MNEYTDPLDKVFATPEERLAYFLKTMPTSLVPIFQREFIRQSMCAIAKRAAVELVVDKTIEATKCAASNIDRASIIAAVLEQVNK